MQNALLGTAHHNLHMLYDGRIAPIPIAAIGALVAERAHVGFCNVDRTLVDSSILGEWALNIGRRDARYRLAHTLCEFALRLEMAGWPAKINTKCR